MITSNADNFEQNFGWRRNLAVFVPEANSLGAVAVIRSLGRAGYRVFAASSSPEALGLLSSYPEHAERCPPYSSDDYKDWLLNFIKIHAIKAIVPSEGFLLAVRPFFNQLKNLLPVPQDDAQVYAAFSKSDVHEKLIRVHADANLPPSLLVAEGARLPSDEDLTQLGLPLFLKVDAVHSRFATESAVKRALTVTEAQVSLRDLLKKYRKVLIQGFVPGKGIGAFFISWNGAILAEFMHRRLHEVPHTGGVSSFRESYFSQTIRDDALAKIRGLEWQGVSMLEYRYDEAAQRMYFIELNARFWGSLHLALYSGVDFPTLLIDAFFGRASAPVTNYQRGVRCRHTFPAETQYVISCLKDPRLPLGERIYPILEFVRLSFDSSVFSDLWFPNDTEIYFTALRRTLKNWGVALGRRLRVIRS